MPIMYVDDSGSPRYMDHTDYFILSGIIVDDDKIKNLQRDVFEYKQSNFAGDFIDGEIHTYDIYKRRDKFSSADYATRIHLLDKLYGMIDGLDCTGIISIVNKKELQVKHPMWDILTVSWSFLLEEYDRYLREHSVEHGMIVIDESTNKTQHDTIRVIDKLRDWGARYDRISKSMESVFDNSAGVYGIQVADAFAYCTLQHIMKNEQFDRYWSVVSGKLEKNGLCVMPDNVHERFS